MTPVDKDDFEDAELARRLAALPQPEPSAEVDAAIFAQVQKDLAPAPAAANDPATEPPRPGLMRRYRTPLAFAASLAGIAILLPVFRTMQREEAQQVNVQLISEDAALPAPPMVNAEAAAPATPPERKREAEIALAKPPKPAPPAPSPMLAIPAPAPEAEPAPVPPPLPFAEYSRAPTPVPLATPALRAAAPQYAPPPSQAPAPAATAPAAKGITSVDVKGSSIKVPAAKDWLDSIEHMLDEGDAASATAQWKRFRQAYPDYPVPDTLAERLKALE